MVNVADVILKSNLTNNYKELIGNEHESGPPFSLDHYFKIVVYDGYVKFEEAQIHRSCIMKDFRDWQPFWFFSVKFVMGYPCVRHYILFYIHGPVILHFLS